MTSLFFYGIIALTIIIGFGIVFWIIKIKDKIPSSGGYTKSPNSTNEYEKAKKTVGIRVFVKSFSVSRKNPHDSKIIKKKLRSLKQENGNLYSESSIGPHYHAIKKIFELRKESDMLREAVNSKKVLLMIRLLARYYLWRY